MGPICVEEDAVDLHKLRNRYPGKEGEGKNGLILKGDLFCFQKRY